MKSSLYASLFLLVAISTYGQKISIASYQNWVNGNWQDTLQDNYSYNPDGFLVQKLQQRWNAVRGAWVNNRQDSYTASGDSVIRQNVTKLWDAAGGSWQNAVMVTDTHNISSKRSVSLTQNWVNGAWQDSLRTTNNYNNHGYLTKQVQQKWSATKGKWVNVAQWKYSNYRDGRINYYVGLRWDTARQVWRKRGKDNFTYDVSARCISTDEEIWRRGAWRENVRGTNWYDANGYLKSNSGQVWDARSNTWIELAQRNYTHNTNGTVKSCVSERWKKSDVDLPGSKQLVSYSYH